MIKIKRKKSFIVTTQHWAYSTNDIINWLETLSPTQPLCHANEEKNNNLHRI